MDESLIEECQLKIEHTDRMLMKFERRGALQESFRQKVHVPEKTAMAGISEHIRNAQQTVSTLGLVHFPISGMSFKFN
ncbi:MAG: hypothetical protein ABJN26_00575 [Stappiaceae bacterium]